MAARKPPAKERQKKPVKPDLHASGARVVGVFGPFASRALIEMPVSLASELFAEPLAASGRTQLVEATQRDIEAIRALSPDVADSALAASALALAYEIEHPYNSATSKAMCAKALLETLDRLRALVPPKRETDQVDDLRKRRAARRAAGGAAAANSSSS